MGEKATQKWKELTTRGKEGRTIEDDKVGRKVKKGWEREAKDERRGKLRGGVGFLLLRRKESLYERGEHSTSGA